MNCPVTCGRPTRMSAEAFARMCAARRDYGNGMCLACGGRPENWPDELTTIEGGEEMGKTIKEQIAEAIAPLKAELDDREARIAELEAELAAAKAAVEDRIERTPVELVDMSAAIYRDALADFAIRVLSGGVAVSFRGPTA